MAEEILSSIAEWHRRGIDFVLVTVVGVRGSTYRGLGARQLIAADGTMVGTVSGGCLDNELVAIATEMGQESEPRLVEFDLTADDEAVWGWGIGCNGVTELIIEVGASAHELAELIDAGPAALLHTLSGPEIGTHIALDDGDAEWGEDIADAKRDGRHRRLHRGGIDYLLEILSSPSRLVVCGAGHDAVPLVRLAKELGYEVTVVDDRRAVSDPGEVSRSKPRWCNALPPNWRIESRSTTARPSSSCRTTTCVTSIFWDRSSAKARPTSAVSVPGNVSSECSKT